MLKMYIRVCKVTSTGVITCAPTQRHRSVVLTEESAILWELWRLTCSTVVLTGKIQRIHLSNWKEDINLSIFLLLNLFTLSWHLQGFTVEINTKLQSALQENKLVKHRDNKMCSNDKLTGKHSTSNNKTEWKISVEKWKIVLNWPEMLRQERAELSVSGMPGLNRTVSLMYHKD